ncbi:MAG: glycosyltransferase family 4 protein [Methylacidiphilales bacterium]|nr:glycosyltransferase family 4 protein [Candidatus Methylacidiphilales bacterium]
MSARRLHILQIFNRYLNYGGEEGSVYRIGDALQEIHDVEYFISSTSDLTSGGLWTSLKIPWKAAYNTEILTRLTRYQDAGRFDAWQIHNIFPVMSPVVYHKALEWGIPIIHYLHNYRFACVNGFFLNHGQPCQRCISGNFWPAFETACWRDSRLQSGWMGLITAHIRRLPLFQKVFQWIAISEAQKQLHVAMGIPPEKIKVIYHFLEPKEPPLPPPPSSSPPTALFIGRLSQEKGVSQLLDAWKLMGSGDRKLLIVGDGPERTHLEQKAARLKGVQFLGFVEGAQQSQIWRQAHFSVVPSIWAEPFGMTLLEAWSHGRPVVAHHIGALPELIRNGENGLLAQPSNAPDLAEKMEKLFSQPKLTQEMGMNGRRYLEARFSRKEWLAETSEIYGKLV